MEFGENARALLSPTVTVCTLEVEEDVVVADVVVGDPPPPPYWARPNGSRAKRISWREKCIFVAFL
jgi:hypothetical protein